ncbi:NAD(P)-binding protein [Mycena vitilis]|nr:NAD(P)-binding protein [Mycena vitilis]
MTPVQNARVLFNYIPESSLSHSRGNNGVRHNPVNRYRNGAPQVNGGFLIKMLVLSIDPYMRWNMRLPEDKSYATVRLVAIQALEGFGVAVVLRSENPSVEVGKYVYGYTMLHQEYTVLHELVAMQILEKHPDLSWSAYLGAAGMPGQTAFCGWKEYSNAKPGEVAFVTAGAGGVGSSDEKVEFMRSLGADVAFNYKTTDTRALQPEYKRNSILKCACRFWDNVGGDTVDAAMEFAAFNARSLECGFIVGYNTGHQAIKNWSQIVGKNLHIHGILLLPLLPKSYTEFYAMIPEKLASEAFKYAEEVTQGLDKVGDVILAVQKGQNKAKAVVVVVVAEE